MARSYEDVIDHSKDEPAPSPPPPVVAPDDAARLRELRIKAGTGPLAEGEKAELDKLALAEAEAAGHPAPAPQPAPEVAPEHSLISDMLAVLEHIVAVVPATTGIAPRLAAMRQRLADLISPPDKK